MGTIKSLEHKLKKKFSVWIVDDDILTVQVHLARLPIIY